METDPLPILTAINWDIEFYPLTPAVILSLVLVLLLLFFSALISGSEVAYFSLSPQDREKLKSSKSKQNNTILHNLNNPEKLLATILVANNFVNVGVVILSAYTTGKLVNFTAAPTLGFIFQVIVITFVLLLFGEIIPKVYATRHSLGFARFMAVPLRVLEQLFRPINSILISSTSFVNKRFHKQPQNISVDELSQALELTLENDHTEDKEILEGIVKFGNKNVVEIMRSRVDVEALEFKDSYSKVINLINDSGYSRIPVYDGSFDNIKGILYIKDLLPHIHKKENFKWQTIIRPPFYVPETKKIDDLLEEFQKNKVHMAIVVDEYGGSSGIVTLEDVLEEIVGEIADEFDEDENYFTKIAENKYLFDGKILLHDFYKITGTNDHVFDDYKGDADTLAGLILELKGEIPPAHEKLKCENFVFSIESVDNRRIKKIKVEIEDEASKS
ncbi:gliding motility-associated protein GldE [Sunxiuqinia elliptica]|uniref:Gliding motility-associated protein GldE n=1 Tax=Sunxiuqinia elliptica TaxID=655355 RepID=A0A1I2FQN1_9BACT|nr:gliding motility-associated protein GldE [Sunxiuqinia elliptica]SFF07774.1 gliding motility-associated protein GldE [Sunxiuqinia elliptica]